MLTLRINRVTQVTQAGATPPIPYLALISLSFVSELVKLNIFVYFL